MRPDQSDELDAMLRGWSGRHSASSEKLDQLAMAVEHQIIDLEVPAESAKTVRRGMPAGFLWVAAGAGLAATIALAFHLVDTHRASEVASVAEGVPTSAHITAEDIDRKTVLAQELVGLFPGRFAWATESGSTVKIGLAPAEGDRPASKIVAIRFTIVSRARGETLWKTLDTLDILTRDEEVVQPESAASRGLSAAVWAYAMPDSMISIETELNLAGPVPIRVSRSGLQHAGTPTELWQSEQNGVEYRVFQDAELVACEHCG